MKTTKHIIDYINEGEPEKASRMYNDLGFTLYDFIELYEQEHGEVPDQLTMENIAYLVESALKNPYQECFSPRFEKGDVVMIPINADGTDEDGWEKNTVKRVNKLTYVFEEGSTSPIKYIDSIAE